MAQEYALDNYLVRGVNHNVVFLRDVMSNQRFLEVRYNVTSIKMHVLNAVVGPFVHQVHPRGVPSRL